MKIIKCKDQAGFTFSETLIAVMIMSMVAAITAAGIPTVKNAYDRVVVAANAEVLLSTAVVELRDEIGSAWNVNVKNTSSTPQKTFVEYFSASTGANTIIKTDSTNVNGKTVDQIFKIDYAPYLINGIISTDGRKERRYPLVSDKASTDDLYITYTNVENVEQGIIRFTGLKVYTVREGQPVELASYGKDSILNIKVASGDVH